MGNGLRVLNLWRFLIALGLALAVMLPSVWGGEPLRDLSKLGQKHQDTKVVRVRTARVIIADYDLLKRDFPHLKDLSPQQIDEWILETAGKVALTQADQILTNTPIERTGVVENAHRPQLYGRGLVFDAKDPTGEIIGYIDGKGFGAIEPKHGHHGSGLATLGESIREFLYEKVVKLAFDHSGSGFDTVGHYAVIDWGFDEVHPDGKRTPAGAVLRQAHARYFHRDGGNNFLSEVASRERELVLRRYGLTGAGDTYRTHKPQRVNLNIQGTPADELVDFGHFLSMDEFHGYVVSYIRGRLMLFPDDPDWVQPDPALRFRLSHWGPSNLEKPDPKFDKPSSWSHELADALRSGKADRSAVRQHFLNMVGFEADRLANTPAPRFVPLEERALDLAIRFAGTDRLDLAKQYVSAANLDEKAFVALTRLSSLADPSMPYVVYRQTILDHLKALKAPDPSATLAKNIENFPHVAALDLLTSSDAELRLRGFAQFLQLVADADAERMNALLQGTFKAPLQDFADALEGSPAVRKMFLDLIRQRAGGEVLKALLNGDIFSPQWTQGTLAAIQDEILTLARDVVQVSEHAPVITFANGILPENGDSRRHFIRLLEEAPAYRRHLLSKDPAVLGALEKASEDDFVRLSRIALDDETPQISRDKLVELLLTENESRPGRAEWVAELFKKHDYWPGREITVARMDFGNAEVRSALLPWIEKGLADPDPVTAISTMKLLKEAAPALKPYANSGLLPALHQAVAAGPSAKVEDSMLSGQWLAHAFNTLSEWDPSSAETQRAVAAAWKRGQIHHTSALAIAENSTTLHPELQSVLEDFLAGKPSESKARVARILTRHGVENVHAGPAIAESFSNLASRESMVGLLSDYLKAKVGGDFTAKEATFLMQFVGDSHLELDEVSARKLENLAQTPSMIRKMADESRRILELRAHHRLEDLTRMARFLRAHGKLDTVLADDVGGYCMVMLRTSVKEGEELPKNLRTAILYLHETENYPALTQVIFTPGLPAQTRAAIEALPARNCRMGEIFRKALIATQAGR